MDRLVQILGLCMQVCRSAGGTELAREGSKSVTDLERVRCGCQWLGIVAVAVAGDCGRGRV